MMDKKHDQHSYANHEYMFCICTFVRVPFLCDNTGAPFINMF